MSANIKRSASKESSSNVLVDSIFNVVQWSMSVKPVAVSMGWSESLCIYGGCLFTLLILLTIQHPALSKRHIIGIMKHSKRLKVSQGKLRLYVDNATT